MEFLHPDTGQLLYYYGMALNGEEEIINYIDYSFFSFTTISTLGYGDIHPPTGLIKMLVISKMFVGTVTFALVLGCVTKGLVIFK
jgi:hypothetical protein